MLLLLVLPPPNAPFISVFTLKEFLRFKRCHQLRNQPLTKCNSQDPLKDVFNNPITVEGAWNAPKMNEQCKAAITTLHETHGLKNSYKEFCLDCYQLPLHHNTTSQFEFFYSETLPANRVNYPLIKCLLKNPLNA